MLVLIRFMLLSVQFTFSLLKPHLHRAAASVPRFQRPEKWSGRQVVAQTQKVLLLCNYCSTTLVPSSSLNHQHGCSGTKSLKGGRVEAEHGGSRVAVVAEWRHSGRHSDRSMDVTGRPMDVTGHRWIPLTKASDAELWYFLWSWINRWVNTWEAGDLRRHRAHYDVIVMKKFIWNSVVMILIDWFFIWGFQRSMAYQAGLVFSLIHSASAGPHIAFGIVDKASYLS